MNNFSIVDKFKNLPSTQRTIVVVVGLAFLWFSGLFSIVSIGFGTWWLWNWWQKKSKNKQLPNVFNQNQQPGTQQQAPPIQPTPQSPPPTQTPPTQNPGPTNRPSIDWRNQP
jgi:hypothetical protein